MWMIVSKNLQQTAFIILSFDLTFVPNTHTHKIIPTSEFEKL